VKQERTPAPTTMQQADHPTIHGDPLITGTELDLRPHPHYDGRYEYTGTTESTFHVFSEINGNDVQRFTLDKLETLDENNLAILGHQSPALEPELSAKLEPGPKNTALDAMER